MSNPTPTLSPAASYLFDTTVFIGVLRNHDVARSLYHQARGSAISVGYSIITEAELWEGIRGYRTVQEHIDLLRPLRRYSLNVSIARRSGELRRILIQSGLERSRVPGLGDCLIAATAEYHALTVCTRNTRHFSAFEPFGIKALEYA